MKHYEIRMICPMCRTEFNTNRPDKYWCSTSCSAKFLKTKKILEINKGFQLRRKQPDLYGFDLELNKWFIKPIRNNYLKQILKD